MSANPRLQYIILLGLKDIRQSNKNMGFLDNGNSELMIRGDENRSRRAAAVNAGIL